MFKLRGFTSEKEALRDARKLEREQKRKEKEEMKKKGKLMLKQERRRKKNSKEKEQKKKIEKEIGVDTTNFRQVLLKLLIVNYVFVVVLQ